MPDVFLNLAEAPPQTLEMIARVLEVRAAIPQQQDMLRTYLRDIVFPADARVLEVGSGTGPVARVLADWPNVREVVGVDPSSYLVERARALSSGRPNLTFETGEGKALTFEDASFDVVILHTVLSHVSGPEAVLAEAHRVLRPGGWLGVCDGDFSTATLATGDWIRSSSACKPSSRASCTTGGWSGACVHWPSMRDSRSRRSEAMGSWKR